MKIFIFLVLFIGQICHASQVIMIGIAGGSGSGKTTVAHKIHEVFPEDSVLICQDYYYKDLSHLSIEERAGMNFDHPDSIEFSLMREQLLSLKKGDTVSVPQFC